MFHTLSAGNIGQLGAPSTVVPVTALTARGADTDGTADEGGADGDVLGRAECRAETLRAEALRAEALRAEALRVEALCARAEAGAALAPAEQPLLAAMIAIRAAAAPARTIRMVTCDVTGIIVASWHGPGGRNGDPVKSRQYQQPALVSEGAVHPGCACSSWWRRRIREEAAMTTISCQPVSVTRTIKAASEELFAFLADPARHPEIDGSGMLRRAVSSSPIGGLGDTFVMSMHNDEMGDYEITNHVVEYERNRRIGWEPVLSAASRSEDQAEIGDRGQHRWIYDLKPVGPCATVVTEIYDCGRAPDWLRRAVRNGDRWVDSMTTTLDRLDQQCGDVRPQPETSALLASLTSQRNHVLGILDGLTEDQLRRPVLPSGWSCLGLVQHLTISVERFWFRGIVAGEPGYVSTSDEEADAAWRVPADHSATAVLDAYRREIELADAVIAGTPISAPPAIWPVEIWPNWRLPDFRAVMLHVITETACHAGHLDAARELIDGRQWMI